MVAKKSSKIILCLFIAFAFLLSLFVGGITPSKSEAIDINQKNDFFQVEVLDTNNISLIANSTTGYAYNENSSAKAYLYKARNTSKFKFKFNFDDSATSSWENAPVADASGNYTLNIQVEFLKGYTSSYFTNANDETIAAVAINTTLQEFASESAGYKSLDSWSPIWNIHAGATADDGQSMSGWGIYRFKMTLGQTVTAYSDFFVLEPNVEVLSSPYVVMKDYGIDKYLFSVDMASEYQYIDENQLTWYAYGITKGGKERYALLEEDLMNPTFINLECSKALHASIQRTGFTFELEKPTIDGEWIVWCEYKPVGSTASRKSNDNTFYIGEKEAVFPYWTIVLGVGVLSVGVCLLIILAKVKHEKIY